MAGAYDFNVRIIEHNDRRALSISELSCMELLTTSAWVFDQSNHEIPWANTKAMHDYFRRRSLQSVSVPLLPEEADTMQLYTMVENDGYTVHITGPRNILLAGIRPEGSNDHGDGVVTLVVSPIKIIGSTGDSRNATLFHETSIADFYVPGKKIDIKSNDTPMEVIMRMLDNIANGINVPMVHAKLMHDVMCSGHDLNTPFIFAKSFNMSSGDNDRCKTIRSMMGLSGEIDADSPVLPLPPAAIDAPPPLAHAHAHAHVSIHACEHPDRQIHTKDTNKWSFDAMALDAKIGGGLLPKLFMKYVDDLGILKTLGIDRHKLLLFVAEIDNGYNKNNPYHNSLHAASVLHCTHMIMVKCNVAARLAAGDDELNALVLLAVFVAAAVHDFRHSGVTNKFLIESSSPLAILYNDTSPHENHHLAASFNIMRYAPHDFLSGLSKDNARTFRNWVIGMVMHTDMEAHFALLTRFKMRALAKPRWGSDKQDVTLVLQLVLKCCDLSHLSYDFDLHVLWVKRLQEEMFLQGEKEDLIGLAISQLCDRTKPGIITSQTDFIDFVAIGMFKQLAAEFPGAQRLVDGITTNQLRWAQQLPTEK
jgi:cAMP-specific phosphodiesterase 4